jgi:serine/threonine protein kinase
MALVETAIDVARAMAHLHKHNIVHSDLKARNVLLRSDAQDPRGFTAKVADFGLSLMIDPNATHISNAFQVDFHSFTACRGTGLWCI